MRTNTTRIIIKKEYQVDLIKIDNLKEENQVNPIKRKKIFENGMDEEWI